MRHRVDHRKLGRTAAHRRAMLNNMVTSLFASERITTTDAKAKEARRLAERLILFDEIAPHYLERKGGYTRIIKMGNRLGDNARQVMLELVDTDITSSPASKGDAKSDADTKKKGKKAEAKADKSPKATKPKKKAKAKPKAKPKAKAKSRSKSKAKAKS